MLRFRTVDINKPAHLSMDERMTRAGRFIRNYSIDDLPNLFNVLMGDMSIVGPRPTEPERVDLEDPGWQRILTLRPGLLSFAIHKLARQYNASSWELRNKLELEYVQNQSLAFDLQILREAARALVASKGNIKARGEPAVEIEDVHGAS
jgi:lipopolysaccharide/colanic/teichoic acid biosynthesis glycosyltransferase